MRGSAFRSWDSANTNELELSLVDTLQESELKSLAVDYAELGIDALLDEGILKEVPIIGTIQKAYSIATSIQNRLYMKKLAEFLVNLADVPKNRRQKQIEKLVGNAKERQRAGENLMLLLDRVNDMSKPAMMARALRAFLLEEIDAPTMWRLLHAIDLVAVTYLPALQSAYKSHAHSEQDATEALPTSPDYHHLAFCGLLTFEFGQLLGSGKDPWETINPDGSVTRTIAKYQKGGFVRNSLGRLFAEKVL